MHMHKKFEVDRIMIKEHCQSYTKAAPQQSWSDLTLVIHNYQTNYYQIATYIDRASTAVSMFFNQEVIFVKRNLSYWST